MTSASQYASLQLAINFKGQRVMMPQPQLNRPIDPTSRSLSDSAQLLVSLCKLISWLFGKLYCSSIHCNGEDWTNVNHLYLFLPCIVLGYFSKAQNSQTDVCAQIFLIKLNSPTESIWDILYFKVAKTQWKGPNARLRWGIKTTPVVTYIDCQLEQLAGEPLVRSPLQLTSTSVSSHLV